MTEQRKQIIEKIEAALSRDFQKLDPSNPAAQLWNNIEKEESARFIASTRTALERVKADPVLLDEIPPQNLKGFNSHLVNFSTEYDRHLQNIDGSQVTNQHHPPLNQLNAINDNLRNFGVITAIKLKDVLEGKIPQLESASKIADTLLQNSEDINDAVRSADQWLSSRKDVNQKTIEEQALAFYERAANHRPFRGWEKPKDGVVWWKWPGFILSGLRGSWLWMLATLTMASLTMFITISFAFDITPLIGLPSLKSESLDVGQALLRIASLLVPAYLTLFCANQFLYHKRLYDNYMFKYSSLETMRNLMDTHKDRAEKILDKGLDVLFTEPKIRESSGKYDTQLVNEVIKMVREQSK